MIRALFVLGSSGAMTLGDCLNRCEEVLICRERYKSALGKVDPSFLTFERILDYAPGGETDVPREHHVELLSRKDPAKIKWIGDSGPANARNCKALPENNPGAHFIFAYRPVEQAVGASGDGLEKEVAEWNEAMNGIREYFENDPEPNGLILAYHDFFSHRNEECIPLLSRFLEMDFGDEVLEAWAETSREFEARRREREPVADEKLSYIEEHKDHEAEAWVLDRIERQWSDPGLYKRTVGEESARRRLADALTREKDRQYEAGDPEYRDLALRAENLEVEIVEARKKAEILLENNRELEGRMDDARNSKGWKLLSKLRGLRAKARKNS